MSPVTLLPRFLSPEEVEELCRLVDSHREHFRETGGRGGLGPRYRVLGGTEIRHRLPEVVSLGERRIRPVVEDVAGRPVVPMTCPTRTMRVQIYRGRKGGFRWHLDGHELAAMVTLRNTNRGETHVIPRRWSRALRYTLYPLYATPSFLSVAPHRRVRTEPGDLLVTPGGSCIHRGVSGSDDGERLLLVFGFDPPGKRRSKVRDFIARRVNY